MTKRISMKERLSELRKEAKIKPRKKGDVPVIYTDKYRSKKKKNELKKFKWEYRCELENMSEEDMETILYNIDDLQSYPSYDSILSDIKKKERVESVRKKHFDKFVKKRKPKTLSDWDKVDQDFDKFIRRERKKLKKKGLIIDDPLCTDLVYVDEKKLIKRLERQDGAIGKINDKFFNAIDDMFSGKIDDFAMLSFKTQVIDEKRQKLIKSIRKNGLNHAIL